MSATEDVALESGPITSPDDSRVCWDSDKGTYYLRGSDAGGQKRTVLVFVGASLGPVHRKGVLQIRIDPAAVRVEEGEKLRWIIEDTHGQKDTTKIQIIQKTPVWPFDGVDPNTDQVAYTAERDATPPKANFVETPGGRKAHPGGGGSFRRAYGISIEFKEDSSNPNSPTLSGTIDPDVVYNPPGF